MNCITEPESPSNQECQVTCYNRSGHHVSGAEYDNKIEYDGIRQKFVPTIERKGLAAVSSSFFAALYSAFGKYDVVHIHAEGPAFFSWLGIDGITKEEYGRTVPDYRISVLPQTI